MTVLNFAFAFVVMLGVLITVHEFGHFVVAKLCGVRVLKFSIGFGRAIGFGRHRLRWERGGTEYTVAWIPLGGYVKMLGENPTDEGEAELVDDPSRTLAGKPLWQKLSVVFAGPGMNLLLPVLLFAAILAAGVQRPAAVIGTVEEGSPAAAAGLRPGDEVLKVDGQPVRWWDEVESQVRERPGESLQLGLARDGAPFSLELRIAERRGLDVFRQAGEVGWLGLRHRRERALIGILGDRSAAATAGLRSGDRITSVGGEPVEDWTALAGAYAARGAQGAIELGLERGGPDEPEVLTLAVPALGDLARLGVVPATVLISQVSPDSAAAAAGLAPGDLILGVDGRPVGSFASFAETVRSGGGRTLQLTYARDGRTVMVPVTPRLTETKTGVGVDEEVYLVGIGAEDATLPGASELDREHNPLVALPRGAVMTADLTALMLRGVGKIITGEVSRKQIGGPIEIARQAHIALEMGWERYLNLLILISINLAILNLLPIPVLDGGQAVLFLLEGIKRGPLSLRAREIAMQIGVTMVLLLMGFAFWNDFSRHWDTFVEWVRNSAGL